MINAIEYIEDEREKQICKGFDSEHDDTHTDGSLVMAAIAYAFHAAGRPGFSVYWPWKGNEFKPGPGRKDSLIKAAALLAAEIERLDRMENSDE